MRLVLLGKTGVGKSSTGNTILGETVFDSIISGCSGTKSCRVEFNSTARVIDTPGLFDTRVSNDIIIKEMVKCIAMSAPGAHAFIVVVKFARFTQEEIDTVNLIKEIFGQDIMRHMIVLFVGKDNLDADGTSIDDFLKEAPDALKRLIRECNNQYIAFNNRAGKEEKRKMSHDLIDLVRKFVGRNDGKCYSHELYADAEANMRAEEEKRMRDLEEKKKKEIEAMKSTAQDATKEEVEDRQKQVEEKFAKLEAEQKKTAREDVIRDVEIGRVQLFGKLGGAIDKAVNKLVNKVVETANNLFG